MFYKPTTKGNHCTLIVPAIHTALNDRTLSNFPDLINLQKRMNLNFWKVNPYLPISIKKFAFKFNIANVNMNSTNPPSSKKKKRKKLFQK